MKPSATTRHAAGYSSLLAPSAAIDMSLNTNPYGCSKRVLEVLATNGDISRYPEPDGASLREALAAYHRVPVASIVLGAGADELIYTIAAALRAAGHDRLVTTSYVFPNIVHAAQLAGMNVDRSPYRPGRYLEALEEAAKRATTRKAPLFICNPSAPFGEVVTAPVLLDLASRLEAPLIVDEAAIEFCPDSSVLHASRDDPRVTVIRSFSKAHGLAGLRVGWARPSEAICRFVMVSRRPFVISTIATLAGTAALMDDSHMRNSVGALSSDRELIMSGLRNQGATVWPSSTNYFVCKPTSNRSQAGEGEADTFVRWLRNGIKVVPVSDFSGATRRGEMVRVATQLPATNARFLRAVLADARGQSHFDSPNAGRTHRSSPSGEVGPAPNGGVR